MPSGNISVIEIDGRVCCASGGSGTFVYTNLQPMPEEVGGYEVGTTFDNVLLQDLFDGLFYPYQYPVFTTFYIDGEQTTLEVGDSIQQNVTFIWNTSNDSNIEDNTIKITNVTDSQVLLQDSVNDGSEVIDLGSDITHSEQASHVFKIEAVNNKSDTFSRNKTYNWNWRLYYGESDDTSLDETQIKALRTSILTTSFSRTYSFNDGGYKYLSYPAVFGTATTFKDTSTNLDVPFEEPYIVSVTNNFGETTDYRVHRTTNKLGGSINIQIS